MNRLRFLEPKWVCTIAAMFLVLLLVVGVLRPAADASREEKKAPPVSINLLVDRDHHAQAFCGGLPAVVSIGGFFEFFEQSLMGKRVRIFSGPWNGELREGARGTWTLSGRDLKSGASYVVVFRQAAPDRVELTFTFAGPDRPAYLSFDILKLSGELFRGAGLESSPKALNDAVGIPLSPSPFEKRVMVTGKNRLRVRGGFCDMEITDLLNSSSILGADCRAVPWDRQKSISFSTERVRLAPGSSRTFSYSVRALPPSRLSLIRNENAVGGPVPEADGLAFFDHPPKDVRDEPGCFQLSARNGIYGSPTGSAEIVLARELRRLTSLRYEIVPLEKSVPEKGIRVEVMSRTARPLPAEGFELAVDRDGIVIRGADARGCLFGAYALLSRFENDQGKWRAPCGLIRDWPDLPHRGICIAMSPSAVHDPVLFRRYLDAISHAGGNLVIFLHEPAEVAGWGKYGKGKGWSRDELMKIAAYARFLHLDVWAGMGSAFRAADFPKLPIAKGTNFYNPFDEESYRILFSLYDRLLETYKPSSLLISHDEISGLSCYAAATKVREGDIFARDVTRVRDWLTDRGVGTAIWGDMLLDHEQWENEVGAANSANPVFNSGATHEALGKLPRDVVVLDWHYDRKKEYRSIDYFRANGLQVMGVPWHDPQAAETLAGSVKRFGGQGMVGTDWGFWRTLSPSATTLSSLLCGWSSKCAGEGNSDVDALAAYLRGRYFSPAAYQQIPVSLDSAANRSTWDEAPGAGRGIFDIGPALDLRALAAGRQSFAGVVFDIASSGGGKRNNCMVAVNSAGAGRGGERTLRLPASDPPVRAIAFLHTCFVPQPQVAPRELGEYVVEYQGGRRVRIALQENWNMTDVRSGENLRINPWTFSRSPDVLAGSSPGWRGHSAAGLQLNAQVFVWRNPFPGERIKSIRLKVADGAGDSSLALLGLTLLQ